MSDDGLEPASGQRSNAAPVVSAREATGGPAPGGSSRSAKRYDGVANTMSQLGGALGLDPQSVPVNIESNPSETRAVGSAGVLSSGGIHLDEGVFSSSPEVGTHMLAHEMAHVAQQRLGGEGSLTDAETEAGNFADAFVNGFATPNIGAPLSANARPTWYPPGTGPTEHPTQDQLSPQGFLIEPPMVRVERLWYEHHFQDGSGPSATLQILNGMTRFSGWEYIADLSPAALEQASQEISLRVGHWNEESLGSARISREILQWIGLPPNVVFNWDFPIATQAAGGQAGQYTARCFIDTSALAAEGDAQQASPSLVRQVLSQLESDVGLTADGAIKQQLIDSGTLNLALDRRGLAAVSRYPREDMVLLFGEDAWLSYEARRDSGDAGDAGDASEGGIDIDPALPEEERQFAERFLAELYGSDGAADQTSATYIGATTVALMHQIDDHAQRDAIMSKLRGDGHDRDPDEDQDQEFQRPLSTIDLYRSAIHAVELEQEYERLGVNADDTEDSGRRPFDYPVEGHIQNHSDLLFTGKTGAFSFTTTSQGDAFAIPWVDVNWVTRRASSRDVSGEVVDRDHTSHRDYPNIAPERYEFDFERQGVYEINALVSHRFYQPNTFTIFVEVASESARMGELNQRTFADSVFDDPTLDSANPVQEGVTEGALDLVCEEGRPSQPGHLDHLEQQMERVRAYMSSPGADPNAGEWAQDYLAQMEDSQREIQQERDRGAELLYIQASYLSRSARGSSQELKLVATAEQQDGEWTIAMHDTTQAFDTRNSRYTGDGDSFREALDEVVDDLAESYPTGTMNLRVETLTNDGGQSGQFLSYTIDTNSTWEEVRTAVWNPVVQITVNIAGAVVMIFAPYTAPFVLPALIAYNAIDTVDTMHDYYERGALTASDVAIGMGQLAIDIIPYVGHASKLVRVGTRAFYVMEGLELAGDVVLMSADAQEQVQTVRMGAVRQAAELHAQIQQREAQNPSDPELPALREQLARVEQEAHDAWANVLATTIAQQGIVRTSLRAISDIHSLRQADIDASTTRIDDAVRTRGDEAIALDDVPDIQTMTGVDVRAVDGIGSDVRIVYDVGALGGITNMRLEFGPDATLSMIRAHQGAVAAMRRYEGVSGSVRNLLERVQAYVSGGGHIPPGSRAFEAHFELQKLPPIIQGFRDRLAEGGLTEGSEAEILRQLQSLDTQLREHAQHLDDLADGLGFVAARGPDGESDGGQAQMGRRPDQQTDVDPAQGSSGPRVVPVPPARAETPRHRALLDQRGTDALVLSPRPGGWTGRHEAEFRWGPEAIVGIQKLDGNYHWAIDATGTPVTVRTRITDDNGDTLPRQRYVGDGNFEPIPDTTNRATRTTLDDNFNVGRDTEAEFTGILENRERLRETRDTAEADLQRMLDEVDSGNDGLRDLRERIEQLRRDHADDPEMLARIDDLEQRRAEWSDAHVGVNQQSELLGQRMAEDWMAQNHPGATLLYGGSGSDARSGDFDQLWLVPGGGRDGRDLIIVIEAKGGLNPTLGTRRVDGVQEQQGTKNYMRTIAEIMSRREDVSDATLDAVEAIAAGDTVSNGPQVQYILVEARIDQSGQGTPIARPGRVSEFEL